MMVVVVQVVRVVATAVVAGLEIKARKDEKMYCKPSVRLDRSSYETEDAPVSEDECLQYFL